MNSHQHWDHYSHQTLYDQIHGKGGFFLPDAAGVSGAAGAQDGWAELATMMAQARERTEAALAKAGAVWEGGAADAMRSGVTPLAQWADDAHTASTASQSSTDLHVSAYSSAKNRMPEPVPVTSTANGDYGGIPAGFTHLFGGQTDQDKQEAAAQDAKAEAVRVMAGYEGESGVAQSSVGQFVPPPSVTVNVAPAEPKGSDVIPVGVSEWPGTGRVIDDSTQSAADSPGPGAAPPPGGSLKPPPPGNASASPGITTPSVATTAPPSVNPVTTGLGADQYRPNSLLVPPGGITVGGTPGERGAGSGGRGPAGRGFGGGFGEGGSAGRGPGAAGGARGAAPGAGALAEERFAGRAGAAGARGTSGMGMGPAGGRAEGDEDEEHQTAEYLRGSHDSFWDDSPPVAPSVIGDEEDD
jgi:hypothetical protein